MNRGKTTTMSKRIFGMLLTIVMVLEMIPVSPTPVMAETGVTVTVKDGTGAVLEGATVEYAIYSSGNAISIKSGTADTGSNGTVEVLSADEYVADVLTITLSASKEGYETSSITGQGIGSSTEKIEVTIKELITDVTVTPTTGVEYDGQYHNAVSVDARSGDTITYSTDGVTWNSDVPQIQDAKKYSVSVKVERTGFVDYVVENLEAEIEKADIPGIDGISIVSYNAKYDGDSHNAVTVSNVPDGCTVAYKEEDKDDFSDVIPTVQNVCEKKITVKVSKGANYNDYTTDVTAKVEANYIDGLSATLYSGLIYNGNKQALIESLNVGEDDTVKYKLIYNGVAQNNGEWTTEAPEATDAGDYTVYIIVERNKYNDTEIALDPATVTVTMADQEIEFNKENKDEVCLSDNKILNIYDFSASVKKGFVDNPTITYSVVDLETNEATDAAEIDANGELTIKLAGSIKIIAKVAGDSKNYNDATVEAELLIEIEEGEKLVTFKNKLVNYTISSNETVTNQKAVKKYGNDNGTITYTGQINGGFSFEDVGLELDATTGKITVKDYQKLSGALNNSGTNTLSVGITANKAEVLYIHKPKVKYDADSDSYALTIGYGSTPENGYTLQDPNGNTLTGPNGENNWYNTKITVVPVEGYTIAKNTPVLFAQSVDFECDNEGKNTEHTVYFKNTTTGEISAPVEISELDNLDNKAPDSSKIVIDYSALTSYENNTMFFNKEDEAVTITISGIDPTSGIDYFTWSYTREDGASESNVSEYVANEDDNQQLEAVQDSENKSKYTATITLPKSEADQLRGYLSVTATDNAGNTSNVKKDDGRILVVDTISPTYSASHELETAGGTQQEIVNEDQSSHYYYSNNVKFTFNVKEANFFGNDVVVKVSKNGGDPVTQTMTWSEVPVDEQNSEIDKYKATLILSGDGDYVVSMTYTDRSGNGMTSYTSDVITIDTTKPVIGFTYSNGNNKTASYGSEQKATITITEHNFRANDIVLSVTAKDIKGNDVSVNDFQAYLRNIDNWSKENDTYTIIISSDSDDAIHFADAIYTMTINYSDLALNAADEADSGEFIVDHTAPSIDNMEISYSDSIVDSILSSITYGFYNPDVTITFSAKDDTSGIANFTWSYTKEEGASETNVSEYVPNNEDKQQLVAVQDTEDKSKYTASVTLPKNEADQLRGTIAFTATDNYGNTSDKLTDSNKVIVVDNIAPTMTVEYAEDYKEFNSKMFYKGDFDITFTVTEANFFAEDVSVKVSKNNGEATDVSLEWNDNSVDEHEATYNIEASSNHENDGEYVFYVSYTDKSNNQMTAYTSSTIVIDTTAPVINVSYDNVQVKNTLTDSDEKERQYFDSARTATITITERNFNSDDVNFSIVAKDVNGTELNLDELHTKSEWTNNGDEHTITIEYPGDANYTFDMAYTDLAGNDAEDYAEEYFTVDTTAPTRLGITYSDSVLDTTVTGTAYSFYNAKVTVTVTAYDNISGVHSFNYSYLKAAGVSGVNAELVNQMVEEGKLTITGATAVLKFEIPRSELGPNNQFNGTVKFYANDRSENKSVEYADSRRIVVDNITPTSSVTYNEPVKTVNGISYYDGPVNATIVVNEANFYPDDMKISVTKDGGSYSVQPTWTDESTDVHRGTFTLGDDGDYVITIAYADKSTNQMTGYTSNQLTVDTKIDKPTVLINGADGNGKAYKDDVIPTVDFFDKNFESCEVKLIRTRYNNKNEDVTKEYVGNNVHISDQGGYGRFNTFVKELETDGIYTLTVTMRDKAEHVAETSVTFTVNRFGSVYVYNDYLNELIVNDGAYVQGVKEDLVITEYNADKLIEGSINVDISRDGRPLSDVNFVMTPEANSDTRIGSSGWYQYEYTIDKSNFVSDGVYKMVISSEDATGNAPETSNYEDQTIVFHVDSTAPEINSITGLEESIVNAQSATVKYNVYDSIALSSIKVIVDGETIETITDFSEDMNSYEGTFVLNEKSSGQKVQIVVEDKAGNKTDTSTEEFKNECAYIFNETVTVSTNVFVRALAWVKSNAGIVVGTLAGVTVLTSAAIFLLKKKRIK